MILIHLQFLQLRTSHPAEKVHNLVLAPFFPSCCPPESHHLYHCFSSSLESQSDSLYRNLISPWATISVLAKMNKKWELDEDVLNEIFGGDDDIVSEEEGIDLFGDDMIK